MVRVNANHRVLHFMRARDHADHERVSDWELGARAWHHDACQEGSDHLFRTKGGRCRGPGGRGHDISALLKSNACDTGPQDAG